MADHYTDSNLFEGGHQRVFTGRMSESGDRDIADKLSQIQGIESSIDGSGIISLELKMSDSVYERFKQIEEIKTKINELESEATTSEEKTALYNSPLYTQLNGFLTKL